MAGRMAKLAKETIQKLAVLRALTLWRKGAYGPVCLHKTMFAADNNNPHKRLFTFKKYYLGQYSTEVSNALNSLRASGRLQIAYDGPAERLKAVVSPDLEKKIRKLFEAAFPQWEKELRKVFREWGYLSNDKILKKAHEDLTYKESEHDQVIFESKLPATIEVPDLSEATAERLTDLVDERFVSFLRGRLLKAVKVPAKASDWRRLYFGETPEKGKAAL